jgi:hypothetical protein
MLLSFHVIFAVLDLIYYGGIQAVSDILYISFPRHHLVARRQTCRPEQMDHNSPKLPAYFDNNGLNRPTYSPFCCFWAEKLSTEL